MNIKKIIINIICVLAVLFVINFIIGIFIVVFSDSGNNSKEEINDIFGSSIETQTEIRNLMVENQDCFNDESLENNRSNKCVIALMKMRNIVNIDEKENMEELKNYYNKNKSSLDTDTQLIIEENIKLCDSEYYNNYTNSLNRFLSAYMAWHKYFRDYVGIKGVDNMTSDEIMQSKTLAQEVLDSEEVFQLNGNILTDYLYENFSKEFITFFEKNIGN